MSLTMNSKPPADKYKPKPIVHTEDHHRRILERILKRKKKGRK